MAETGFKVGELIENRYRVLAVVGAGGMGTLYRVADEAREDEVVALKTVRLDVPTEAPESVERFQREFQLLTQLRHPNLVSVYDYGITAEGGLYFTMEWIEGQDLEPGRRPLEPRAVIPVIVQVCRALAYLHARGVIHGDLKPANVLLTGNQVKLVDFGVALEMRAPEVRARYYTPYYAAPEVRQLRSVDHRADLYSLGAVWYTLLTGEPPPSTQRVAGYERLVRLMLTEALTSQEALPAAIGAVIARLLAVSPADRYTSANEVIAAVNELAGSAYALETRETAVSYALRTRFVNREAEVEVLQTLWKQAQDGEGQVVLISGESGVGKTRLVEELEVQAEVEGAWVVWGQCVEQGGSAYHPWREVLRVLVRYVEGADERVMPQVGPVLATLLPELWQRPYMADLPPPAELDPQAAQQRLNNAIAQVIRAAAGLRPTVVVLEDVHWADEATLELLRFLARVLSPGRVLVCVTYRGEEVGAEHLLATLAGERVQRIQVSRLSPAVTTDLARVMLGLEELPVLLTERLQQTTGGNAFFVQELIRSLAAEGEVLQRTVEGWQVDGQALQEAQLPESIRQVVERRLGQVSMEARRVLEWGAAVGMTFWEGSVAEAGQVTRAEVRAALGELLEQELVVVRDETSFVGEREYLFLNPTVRAMSYGSIPQDEQREAHGRTAAWLLAHGEEKVDQHLGLIAEHLEKSGQVEQAVEYLQRAGEQTAAQFANAEAIRYLSRALDLMPEEDWAERYALLLAREKVYDLQGAREAQRQDLVALGRLAEELDDDAQLQAVESRRAEVALRQANYCTVTGDYPAATAAAQEAIHLAKVSQDVNREAAGYVRWGVALWRQGNPGVAQPQLERALTLARISGLREIEATCLHNLGVVSRNQGDYAGARAYYEQALRIYHEIGDRQRESAVLGNLGYFCDNQGDYGGARAYYEQTLRIKREVGDRRGERIVLSNLSLLHHHLGDDEAAREYSQHALLIAREIDDRLGQGYALTNLGHALAGLDHLAEAADAYRQALTLRRELGQHNVAIESLAGLVRVSLAQSDPIQAQTHVEDILNHLESHTLGGTEEPLRIYLTCYWVLRANGDPRTRSILDVAHQELQEQAAKITDEEMRHSFLENVAAHREIVYEFEKQSEGEDHDLSG